MKTRYIFLTWIRTGYLQNMDYYWFFSFCFLINEKNLKSCAEGGRKRKSRVSLKADSHITCRAHAVPLPCRAAKGLECVFPI